MGFSFWLKSNNGKSFDLESLQELINDNGVADNSKLKKLFSLFDTDHDGKISVTNSKGENELKSIFNKFSSIAGEDKILEEDEVSKYLTDNNLDKDLSVKDVFDFLGKFIKSKDNEDVEQSEAEAISEIINALETYLQSRVSQQTISEAEYNEIKKEAYNIVITSTVSTEKTEKDYDDLFTFAKEKLSAFGETPTLEELNLYVTELQLLNDIKADKKIKKGTAINLPAKSLDKTTLKLLQTKGIQIEEENYLFFQKLLELDDKKRDTVLDVVKNSEFNTKEEVINEVYTKTRINLADTGLTIKVGGVSSTLENFITKTLKLDLSSKEGSKIYEILCSLGKDTYSVQKVLDSLPTKFIDKISKMSDITFDKFADVAEIFGIILRSDEKMREREKNSQEYRDFKARLFMAQYVADNYDAAVTISQNADRELNFMQGAWWVRHSRPVAGTSTTDEQRRDLKKVEQIKQLMQDIYTMSNEEFANKMIEIMEAKRTAYSPGAIGAPVAATAGSFEVTDCSFKFDPELAYTFMKQKERAELAAYIANRLEPQRKEHNIIGNNYCIQPSDNTRVNRVSREVTDIQYTVEDLNDEELKLLKEYINSIQTRKELFLFAQSLHYKLNATDILATMIPKKAQEEIQDLLAKRAKELGYAESTDSNRISINTFRNIFTQPIAKNLRYPKTDKKTIMETYEDTKTKLFGRWDPVGQEIKTQEIEGTIGSVVDIAVMILITKGIGSMGAFVKIGNAGRNVGMATNVFKSAKTVGRFSKNAKLLERLAKIDEVLGGLWVNGSAGAAHGFATMGAYGGLQGVVSIADNIKENLLEGKEWSDGWDERVRQTLEMSWGNAKFGLFAGYSGVLAQTLGRGTTLFGVKGFDKLFKTNYSKKILDKVSSVVTEEGISGSKFWAEMQKASMAEGFVGFGYESGFFALYHRMEADGVDFNDEESILNYIEGNLDQETKESFGATYLSEGKNLALFKTIGWGLQWIHIGRMSASVAGELALKNMRMKKVVKNGQELYIVKFNENDKPIECNSKQLMRICEHKVFCANVEDKVQKDGSFELPNNQIIKYDKTKNVYKTDIDSENTLEGTSVEDLLLKINQTTFRNQINGQIFKNDQPVTVKSLLKLVITQNGEPIKINGVEIKPEEVLENSEALDNVKIVRTTVNSNEVYIITLADGKTETRNSLEEVLEVCRDNFNNEIMRTSLNKMFYQGIEEGFKNNSVVKIDDNTIIMKNGEGSYRLIEKSGKNEKIEISGVSVEDVFNKAQKLHDQKAEQQVKKQVHTTEPETKGENEEVNQGVNQIRISECTYQNGQNSYNISVKGKEIIFKVDTPLDESRLSELRVLIEKVDDIELLQNLNNVLVKSGGLITRRHLEQLERLYNYKKQNPDFPIEQILNHELILNQNATQNFDLVNSILYGEKPEKIKSAELQFEQTTGVKIHFQYDALTIDIEDITDNLSKAIERFKATGRPVPSDIYLTDIMIGDKHSGYFVASETENKNWYIVLKNKNINRGEDYYNKVFFHESVHMSEMNVSRDDLYGKPIGTEIDPATNEVVYDGNKGAKLIANTQKYVSKYSATNINEFKAELGTLMLQDKISVEFVGDKIRVTINEPFKNLNGIEIKIDETARKEIEELVKYYFSVGGQNYSIEPTTAATKPAETVVMPEIPEHQQKIHFTATTISDITLSKERVNFTQYGKNGIPLKYSRESFIKDLGELLSSISPAERAKIEAEFDIKIVKTDFNNLGIEIVGIPSIPKDFVGTPNEQAVAKLIRKYTSENEVEIADKETKELLDSILHTFPEFAMTIGKKQHGTHDYSVDIHTLKNLQDNLANPKYAELDEESQLVLKYATILHDIGKRFLGDHRPDHGHAALSVEYATKILERFDLSDEVKARIIKQIQHHHWFEGYNKGHQSPEEVAKVVAIFGTIEDFTIAEIMAKSDYQNVNYGFHLSRQRSRVIGEGLMSAVEFENFMTASFEKIENQFKQDTEKSNSSDITSSKDQRPTTTENTTEVQSEWLNKNIDFLKESIHKRNDLSDYYDKVDDRVNEIVGKIFKTEDKALSKPALLFQGLLKATLMVKAKIKDNRKLYSLREEVLNKILSDPVLYENKDLQNFLVIDSGFGPRNGLTDIDIKTCENILAVLDIYQKNPKYSKIDCVREQLGHLIFSNPPEAIFDFIDNGIKEDNLELRMRICSECPIDKQNLKNIESFLKLKGAESFIENTENATHYITYWQIKDDFWKVLKNAEKDVDIMSNYINIFNACFSGCGRDYKLAQEMLKRILENPQLRKNECILSNIEALCNINSNLFGMNLIEADVIFNERVKVLEAFANNKNLQNNKFISDNIALFCEYAANYSKCIPDLVIDFMDKISKNENLAKCKVLNGNCGNVKHLLSILHVMNNDNYDAIVKLLDNISSNPKYDILNNHDLSAITIIETINNKNYEHIIKIIEDSDISEADKLAIIDDQTLLKYAKYYKKEYLDLTRKEKRELINDILINKTTSHAQLSEEDFNNPMCQYYVNSIYKKYFEVVPLRDAEYVNMLHKLSQSLNIRTDKLSETQINKFNSTLSNLTEFLQIQNLDNLFEIKLKFSQEDLLNKIDEISKNLSKQDKKVIYDLFGIEINNGKLAGYPNSDKINLDSIEIKDENVKTCVRQIYDLVQNYNKNNVITINDYPELNNLINNIAEIVPEIYNQIDGTDLMVKTIKTLQKVISNPEFNNLTSNDQKVLIVSTLFHNTNKTFNSSTESAFDTFFIAQKLGFSDHDAKKIYTIVENSNAVEFFMSDPKSQYITKFGIKTSNRRQKFDNIAFNLKEGNSFKLTQMLYSANESDGLTRTFDKMLEDRIKQIKSSDFVLVQTPASVYTQKAKIENINGYDVPVTYASDIENFYALIHTPEASFTFVSQNRDMKFANFDAFKDICDNKIICTSYIGTDYICGARDHGFIFAVENSKQYIGKDHDIWSQCKNIEDMLEEYYSYEEIISKGNRGEKSEHREYVSKSIKKLMNISDDEYIRRVDRVKELCGDEVLTMDKLKEIDRDMYKAYKKFLSINASGNVNNGILRNDGWNEVLVNNPKICAIYTYNIKTLPVEYLIKAQEENIPIVIIDNTEKSTRTTSKTTTENFTPAVKTKPTTAVLSNHSTVESQAKPSDAENHNLIERINSATSRQELNKIRDEINKLQDKEEKEKLYNQYRAKYEEFSANRSEATKNMTMQYTPNAENLRDVSVEGMSEQNLAIAKAKTIENLKDLHIDDYSIEYILKDCNNDYEQLNFIISHIKTKIQSNGLSINNGYITIENANGQDYYKYQERFGHTLLKLLQNKSIRIEDLVSMYLFGNGKYTQDFVKRDFLDNLLKVNSLQRISRMFCPNPTCDRELIQKIYMEALNYVKDITPEQRDALIMYKGDDFQGINSSHNDYLKQKANQLDECLTEHPLQHTVTVRRFTNTQELVNIQFADGTTLKDVLENKKEYGDKLSDPSLKSLIGQSFVNKNFVSATFDKSGFQGEIMWEMEVEENTPALPVETILHASKMEAELLINRNCKYTVTDVNYENGVMKISVKVQANEGVNEGVNDRTTEGVNNSAPATGKATKPEMGLEDNPTGTNVKLEKGYILDSKTQQPIKVNTDKLNVKNVPTLEGKMGTVSIDDEFGNSLGVVTYNLTEIDGQKFINFEGLQSNVEGAGIGSRLIKELISISKELGAEGRLIASASPMANKGGKLTNIEFYYKMGFRAVDPEVDAEIRSYIEKGEEVPLRLNIFTKIELKPETAETKPVEQ